MVLNSPQPKYEANRLKGSQVIISLFACLINKTGHANKQTETSTLFIYKDDESKVHFLENARKSMFFFP